MSDRSLAKASVRMATGAICAEWIGPHNESTRKLDAIHLRKCYDVLVKLVAECLASRDTAAPGFGMTMTYAMFKAKL